MYGKSDSGGKIIVCARRLIKPRGHRVSLLLDLVRVRIIGGVAGTRFLNKRTRRLRKRVMFDVAESGDSF